MIRFLGSLLISEYFTSQEENWHRRKTKEDTNIQRETVSKQRHWTRIPTGHAPACVT